jgi:hypothetical protein
MNLLQMENRMLHGEQNTSPGSYEDDVAEISPRYYA